MAKQPKTSAPPREDARIQEFPGMIAPSIIKFNTDYFICGNTFRFVWVLREYPASTEEQTILRYLGGKDGAARFWASAGVPLTSRRTQSPSSIKSLMDVPLGRRACC